MVDGLDYAIESLKRRAKRHKYYTSGDYSKASIKVKEAHLHKIQECESIIEALKSKKRRFIKKGFKQLVSK